MKQTILLLFAIAINSGTIAQTMSDKVSYKGTIGNQPIHLNFYVRASMYFYDYGDYYYDKYKKTITFEGTEAETENDNVQELYESVNGKKTGYFIFDSADYYLLEIIGNKTITGKWYSMDGSTSHKVTLTLIPGK